MMRTKIRETQRKSTRRMTPTSKNDEIIYNSKNTLASCASFGVLLHKIDCLLIIEKKQKEIFAAKFYRINVFSFGINGFFEFKVGFHGFF
jgi:hypothetical protein